MITCLSYFTMNVPASVIINYLIEKVAILLEILFKISLKWVRKKAGIQPFFLIFMLSYQKYVKIGQNRSK